MTRGEDSVQVRDVTGQVTRVDRVVIATHADQALGLLSDPSDARAALAASSDWHRQRGGNAMGGGGPGEIRPLLFVGR